LDKWQYEKNVNVLYNKIKDVRNVKTIWQTDKKINLMSFYYPSKLIINETVTLINASNKIPGSKIIIEGTAGQGKSIFLRYLCTQELTLGGCVPIFFQLRKIQKGETLKQNIYSVLDAWCFNINDDLFDYLAKEGKITLFLDGFDELLEDQISGVVKELELYSEKYQNMKIIITSRPNSGLQNCEYFDVYQLAPLGTEDYLGLLSKLIKDHARVQQIAKAIKESGPPMSGLLTTPLMMTLLVFVYQSEQKIPNQLSEFYEQLFPLMFYRHDKTKPGFTRKRHCNLNERDIQKIFEAVCYITRKQQLTELKEGQMISSAEEALTIFNSNCDVRGFINDITRVSCLIVEEGLSYYFIHKSVQEYHSACFIRHRPDSFAEQFYSKMISQTMNNWRNELSFLEQIDRYRFNKYYYIPDIEHIFKLSGINEHRINDVTSSQLKILFQHVEATLDTNNCISLHSFPSLASNHDRIILDFLPVLPEICGSDTRNAKINPENVLKTCCIVELFDELGLWDKVINNMKPILQKYKNMKTEALKILEGEVKINSLLP